MYILNSPLWGGHLRSERTSSSCQLSLPRKLNRFESLQLNTQRPDSADQALRLRASFAQICIVVAFGQAGMLQIHVMTKGDSRGPVPCFCSARQAAQVCTSRFDKSFACKDAYGIRHVRGCMLWHCRGWGVFAPSWIYCPAGVSVSASTYDCLQSTNKISATSFPATFTWLRSDMKQSTPSISLL